MEAVNLAQVSEPHSVDLDPEFAAATNYSTQPTVSRRAQKRRTGVLVMLENCPYPDDTRVRHETQTLAEAGYDVAVIAPAKPGDIWHEHIQSVHVYRYPPLFTGNHLLGYMAEYGWAAVAGFGLSIYVAIRHGFEILHITNPPDTYVFLSALYKLIGKKIVFDHHDLSPELYEARFGDKRNALIHRVLVWLERWSCRVADHILATNESYKLVEINRCGIEASRITVVRNGPRAARFRLHDPAPEVRQCARHIICYCGEINRADGVDYLLRAAKHVVHGLQRTDTMFVVIGDGDAMPELRRMAAELEIEPYLWFTGWISDRDQLVRFLSAADICVAPEPSNPYNDQSTMVKTLEYMALEKPIVAFDLPEQRRSAGEAAVYVSGNSAKAFAQAILKLIDDPARRVAMGSIGRNRIESGLSWDHSANHLLQAYDEVRRGLTRQGRLAALRAWVARRPFAYTVKRLFRLFGRYGVRERKATLRVLACVRTFAEYGCNPTFAVPGRVLERRPHFFKQLQEEFGTELMVHGYDHVDFRGLTPGQAATQVNRALRAFAAAGVHAAGIRCPYLSATEEFISSIKGDRLSYSSNEAICWNRLEDEPIRDATFRTLSTFYHPADADTALALPHEIGQVLELPAALPDDLQLYDGLHLRGIALTKAWMEVIRRIYDRGELCVLLFHPELFDELRDLFVSVLREMRLLEPKVWITRLRDVSDWWREKQAFSAQIHRHPWAIHVDFDCSDRATVLARNVEIASDSEQWFGSYRIVPSRSFKITSRRLPLLGLAEDVPEHICKFLADQGYIVRRGHGAEDCETFLDGAVLATFRSNAQLVEALERSEAPLLRFWRWPNGARSALCFTGDLDALSLRDYAVRLFT